MDKTIDDSIVWEKPLAVEQYSAGGIWLEEVSKAPDRTLIVVDPRRTGTVQSTHVGHWQWCSLVEIAR